MSLTRQFVMTAILPPGPVRIQVEAASVAEIFQSIEDKGYIDGIEPTIGKIVRIYKTGMYAIGEHESSGAGIVRAPAGVIFPRAN